MTADLENKETRVVHRQDEGINNLLVKIYWKETESIKGCNP
jgi:hypothetical protein